MSLWRQGERNTFRAAGNVLLFYFLDASRFFPFLDTRSFSLFLFSQTRKETHNEEIKINHCWTRERYKSTIRVTREWLWIQASEALSVEISADSVKSRGKKKAGNPNFSKRLFIRRRPPARACTRAGKLVVVLEKSAKYHYPGFFFDLQGLMCQTTKVSSVHSCKKPFKLWFGTVVSVSKYLARKRPQNQFLP